MRNARTGDRFIDFGNELILIVTETASNKPIVAELLLPLTLFMHTSEFNPAAILQESLISGRPNFGGRSERPYTLLLSYSLENSFPEQVNGKNPETPDSRYSVGECSWLVNAKNCSAVY